nr:reverse transcriptase domain-containing protein [Tanacetum cinerariifolium]
MKISSFMDAHKCPELAKRYSNKVPKMVDEMMVRVDDFVRMEEAFSNIELPKGEISEASKKLGGPVPYHAPRGDHQGPMQLPPKKENQDRYCDYHGEKGYYTNDYFQLRRQLKSRKLNHIIKDVRQRGRGNTKGRDGGKDKVIEAVIEGYLVCRIYVDQGADVVKPLGKIKLEVVFGERGLFRRVMMKFMVIRAPSPYNVILGRTSLKTLRAVSSSIHSMVKFPTPRGIAKLVTRNVIISKCRRLEKKQMAEKEAHRTTPLAEAEPKEVRLMEEILVNPAYPEQLLKALLKKNMDIFAWDPSDMIGVDEGWRMYIDFKNINSACLKDYYPLSDIDGKIESVVGFRKEETLYVYLAAAAEAVSAVLLKERKGKLCPVHNVSITLNEAEMNYALLKKLALSLLHMSRRLRRNPTRGILPCFSQKKEKDDIETWNLFIDGASNSKGSGAGLFLISPSDIEFTYALCLNFTRTNNEAEYKALLAGIRMAARKKWGMDILVPLPQSDGKIKFVIVAIDYFTKWIEAKPLARITRKEVKRFVWDNIIYRANKSLMEGIKIRLGRDKAGWINTLQNVLWANQTSLKQSNRETPFSLTYGSEDVIPTKIGMPTHRTMMLREDGKEDELRLNMELLQERIEDVIPTKIGMPTHRTMMLREDEKEDELRLNMELLQERIEVATIREARYKTKMEHYYNQNVRLTSFKTKEYVFRRNEASRVED